MKPFAKIYVLLLLFILSETLQAHEVGTIKGCITDSANNEPIRFATIMLKKGDVLVTGTISALDGCYVLQNIPLGTYTLTVSFVGYRKYVIDVIIENAKDLERNVSLVKSSESLEVLPVTITKMGTIKGKIIAEDKPVPLAIIRLKQDDVIVAETGTDYEGCYSIDVPYGSYQMVVNSFGYYPSETHITVDGKRQKKYEYLTSNIVLHHEDLNRKYAPLINMGDATSGQTFYQTDIQHFPTK